MTFLAFQELVSKIGKIGLLGEKAHAEMSPLFRKENLKKVNWQNLTPRKAGVMVLFYPNKNQETNLVLILRKTYKGVHSAQVGFPGGKAELFDKDIKDTALRETYEEVGVLPQKVEIIRPLTEVYIPPSNFLMYPFLGYAKNPLNFIRQEEEVEAILEVKLQDFLATSSLITQKLSTSYAQNVEVPAFLLQNQIVWGATGMVLNEVKHLVKAAMLEL